MVYHPHRAPQKVFYRRWVYFPAYNLYWDNVRELYVYRKGTAWVKSVAVLAFVINVDLGTAKHEGLPEKSDNLEKPSLKDK